MPAPVDSDQRRQNIGEIVADIISRDGLDAVTIRQVAAAAGCSTTIVTHYFANKRDLLLHTYQAAAGNAQARVDAVLAQDAGDIEGYLEAQLPLDAASLRDWRVYLAFWPTASIDPEFAAEQRRWTQLARDAIAGILAARAASDKSLRSVDPVPLARRLLTLLQGIAVQAVFDPDGWSAGRQRKFLAEELLALLATAAPLKSSARHKAK